jgi:hypothetical protein
MTTNTYTQPFTDYVLCEVPDYGYQSASLQTQPLIVITQCTYSYADSIADLLNESIISDVAMNAALSDPEKKVVVMQLAELAEYAEQGGSRDAREFVGSWANHNRRLVVCDEREYTNPSLYAAHLANVARVHMPESL